MLLPQKLAKPVESVARQAMGKHWHLYAGLLEHWEEIVGADYARCTTPAKISFPPKASGDKLAQDKRTDGTLHIRLPQGLVLEFTYQTERIRQRLTSYFGYNAIARIVFEPYYSQKAPSSSVLNENLVSLTYEDNRLEQLDNPELAETLRQLGAYIHAPIKGQR